MANIISDFKYSSEYYRRLSRLGLIENPFTNYEDGRYFFPTTEQIIAYQEVLVTLSNKPEKNINLIVGERKTGKTTLAKRLVNHSNSNIHQRSLGIYIQGNETFTPSWLIKTISNSIGLPFIKDNDERILDLENQLRSIVLNKGNSVFLAIDGPIRDDTMATLLSMASWTAELVNDEKEVISVQSLLQIAMFGGQEVSLYPSTYYGLPLLTKSTKMIGNPSLLDLSTLLEKQVRAAGKNDALFTPGAIDTLIEGADQNLGDLMQLANLSLINLIESNGKIITEALVYASIKSKKTFPPAQPEFPLLSGIPTPLEVIRELESNK